MQPPELYLQGNITVLATWDHYMLQVHMMFVLTAHLLHGEVPDVVAEWAPAGGAAGQLGPAVGADQVTRVTLNTQMSVINQRPGSVSVSQSGDQPPIS